MGTTAVNIMVEGINSLLEKREVGVDHRRIAPELVIRGSTRGLPEQRHHTLRPPV
jgi:DNA-binding LacI/PurR family transcriptional regulator